MRLANIARAASLLVVFAAAGNVCAGTFSVTPVRIFADPRDRAVAVTVTNEGDQELVMQADLFSWSQRANGEDNLVPTEDLVLSPPILKLPPKARQVVRLALIGAPKSERQLTYRMIAREVPEVKSQENVQLQIALAFSIPVFITPPKAKADLGCTIRRAAPDAVNIECENHGNAYAMPRDFALNTASGQRVAGRDNGGYLLPGTKRTFELKASVGGTIAPGQYRLLVGLDDGSTKSFDVPLSE